MRAKDFFGAFFQYISRLDQGATQCAIAQASAAKRGLPERARSRMDGGPARDSRGCPRRRSSRTRHRCSCRA